MHPTLRAYLAAGFRDESAMLEHARLRGDAAYLHLKGVLAESAGNIQRLLGFTTQVSTLIHEWFGGLDFPAAKLLASIGHFEDGPVAVDSPADFKNTDLVDEDDVHMMVVLGFYGVWDALRFPSEDPYHGAPDDLADFLRKNPQIVPKINSAKAGPECLELVRQVILSKKRPTQPIVKLESGWSWVDLGSGCDDVEAAEMQHCGTDSRGHLVSLRDPHNNAHVTMTYDKASNIIYQIKGKQNTVPVQKYWPAIISFFEKTGAKLDDWWLTMAAEEEPAGDDFDLAPELLQKLSPFVNEELALDEAAENSIAMVVVPGDPPGKNVTGLIRSLVGGRTKLIVVAQSGKLAPGNFERLLRASMPDVEKKLRIMDGGGSIADAVNSAERNRHYRPSQALEVYADPQLARGFSSEVSDGSLGFDPTTIQVHPTEIPTDDLEALLTAVFDDDLDAMHRTLDPHVFSDQDALRTYKDVLKAGQLPDGVEVAESVVREFLTDIAPSRELGIAKLDAILQAELGAEFADLEYLGSGRNGSAYRMPDGLILKITTDPAEADSAEKLVGIECEYIHRVHSVQQIGENVWALVQEELESLPAQYAEEFDLAMEILETIGAGHALRSGDAHGIKEVMMSCEHPDLCLLVAEVMRKFDVGGMLREVAQLGLSGDFHSGNVKLREGRPVLTDLGTPGDDPHDVKKVKRRVSRQVSELGGVQAAPQAGPPASMRGSNSSAWAAGKSVLSKPDQHVPEDENANERDNALDQDIVGGGLDWGNGLSKRGY